MQNERMLELKSRKKGGSVHEDPSMFIGDYKKSRLKKELTQIDKEILEIESNLKEELSSSRSSLD